MIRPTDVDSFDHFKRNAKKEMAALRRHGRPKVLTVNGKPSVVVQDAAAYEAMLDALDEAETIAAVREAKAEIDRGEGIPAAQVFDEILGRKPRRTRKSA